MSALSNCICVRINNKLVYAPAKWDDDNIQAWYKKQWVTVINTGKRNQYKDYIFEVKS